MASSKRLTAGLQQRKSDASVPTFRSHNSSSGIAGSETVVAAELPWGVCKMVANAAGSGATPDFNLPPAQFSTQALMYELLALFERKINQVAAEDKDKPLNKSLRREDPYFEHLLKALNEMCEFCLPPVLTALIKWYEQQQRVSLSESGDTRDRSVKRTLVASHLVCIVLVEILPQLHFHPRDCEQPVNEIVRIAFHQISYKDPAIFGVNYEGALWIGECFAEVLGVLSQWGYAQLVQKTFFELLAPLRKESPPTSLTIRQIISLLKGLMFFRIKTSHFADFESGVRFLDELGSYYLEVDLNKHKDLKHALAGLLVEIIMPVAAQIKMEANVPALIAFVDKLYSPTYELVNKKQHKLAAYPLLTCLLCVSQTKFFLSSWVQFLNLTLANLKNKDAKMARVALESLYRLIWVYTIRISCEGNTTTRSRLESICSSLFPRGNRNVVPRDTPMIIFIKIIQFIAQQKLDFAFREIIFDLLGSNRNSTRSAVSIYPQRMDIGLRALMVIAEGLELKEEPSMPKSMAPPSGTMLRTKKSYITHPITHDVARSLGLEQYYSPCRKAFDAMLRTLDLQVGRPLMLTAAQVRGKEYADLVQGEVKAKLDLLQTCLAAVPRLLPDPMSHLDLIDMLTRMCIHIDAEIRVIACQALQSLMTECPAWREDIIHTSLRFLTNNIQDGFPSLLESTIRLLLQLLCTWRSLSQNERRVEQQQGVGGATIFNLKKVVDIGGTSSNATVVVSEMGGRVGGGGSGSMMSPPTPSHSSNNTAYVIHGVEGYALVLLCQQHPTVKKLAISLLRECRQLLLQLAPNHDTPMMTVLDGATPYVIAKYIEHVPLAERQCWPADFTYVSERIERINVEQQENGLVGDTKGNEWMRWDAWACALSGYCEHRFLLTQCPTAVSCAWPVLYSRLGVSIPYVDPANPQNESRASLLRTSKSKSTASALCGEVLSQESYLALWQKYLVMCCALAQPATSALQQIMSSSNTAAANARSFSPSTNLDDLKGGGSMISSTIRMARSTSLNCTHLFQKVSGMLRWEHMTDMRDSVVLGLGSTNPACFDALLEELNSRGILREAMDKKVESNARRRKRKDQLRLQILRIAEVALFRHSLLADSHPLLLDFLDSIRQCVEVEGERDPSTISSLRLHFSKCMALLVNGMPLERRASLLPLKMRHSTFAMLFGWCGGGGGINGGGVMEASIRQHSVKAMCALICCGAVFEVGEEEYLYRWLETFLSSPASTLINAQLPEETLSLLLHLNEHHSHLLDWCISVCYGGSELAAGRCFRAMAMLFSRREYPCEFISLLVLGQVFSLEVDGGLRRTALLFIQLLRRHFLDDQQEGEECEGVAMGNSRFPMTQAGTSLQLARTYTHLTMSIYSEVCSRIEGAKPRRRAALLTLLIPWLENIELVDGQCDIVEAVSAINSTTNCWGSEEATPLLLNNLLHLTALLSMEHPMELSALWSCLAKGSAANLPIMIHYIFVVVALAEEGSPLVGVVKRIGSFLLNSCGERFITLLIDQMISFPSGDAFKQQLMDSDMPPFYRWQPNNNEGDGNDVAVGGEPEEEAPTQEEQVEKEERLDDASKSPDPITTTTSNLTPSHRRPKQLPMPPYGGHYSNLRPMLHPTSTSSKTAMDSSHSTYSRSNLALFLLADLLGGDASVEVEWSAHTPAILHYALINLDSTRPEVCAHSRRAIINICLMGTQLRELNIGQVSGTLLVNQLKQHRRVPSDLVGDPNLSTSHLPPPPNHNNDSTSTVGLDSIISCQLPAPDYHHLLMNNSAPFASLTELLTAIVHCLSASANNHLWQHEEVSTRAWRIPSADQLACFTLHLADYLSKSMPMMIGKWIDVAVDVALTSSNRHFAGRSFQVLGELLKRPAPFIPRLLSRLAEVVGEQNEEAQSYITGLMLCLQKVVPHLSPLSERNSAALMDGEASPLVGGHIRSISYTPALLQQISPVALGVVRAAIQHSPSHPIGGAKKETLRHSLLIENASVTSPPSSSLTRSKSAILLKLDSQQAMTDEELNALCLLFDISVTLLESGVENEFLLSLHLLERILTLAAVGPNRIHCLHNLEKTLKALGNWSSFPGIIGLTSRGSLFASAGYETMVSIMVECVPLLHHEVVGGNDSIALVTVAVLPYCLSHFDSPTSLCSASAQAIAAHCTRRLEGVSADEPSTAANDSLRNLATVIHNK